jgi:hypothetical protein
MWFRTINGNLIEINRKDFISCKEYNTSITSKVLNIKQINKEKSELDYVLNIIKNK